MRTRIFAAGLVAAAIASLAPLAAQSKGTIRRKGEGHPDLQGTYDLATLTPVERTAGSPLVMLEEETSNGEKQVGQRKQYGDTPLNADRAAPPVGGDGSAG